LSITYIGRYTGVILTITVAYLIFTMVYLYFSPRKLILRKHLHYKDNKKDIPALDTQVTFLQIAEGKEKTNQNLN